MRLVNKIEILDCHQRRRREDAALLPLASVQVHQRLLYGAICGAWNRVVIGIGQPDVELALAS